MERIHFKLLGRFEIEQAGRPLTVEGQRAQELLCYLLSHPDRSHTREHLTTLMWPDHEASQVKQYFRQTLYKLQLAARGWSDQGVKLLTVDAEWIEIDADLDYDVDINVLEAAWMRLCTLGDASLEPGDAALLRQAINAYRGDFLESWYEDWCLRKRALLESYFRQSVDKLMHHCQRRGAYAEGLDLGSRLLKLDVACERTHRRMIRLRYMSGDRTGALRQYARCVDALAAELTVTPGSETKALVEAIRDDRPLVEGLPSARHHADPEAGITLAEVVARLHQLQAALTEMRRQYERQLPAAATPVTRPRPLAVNGRSHLGPATFQSRGPVL